jgi:hypothetical protein
VHDDAQLAVVGVSLVCVQVRGLCKGQQGQQDEAQCCHRNPEAAPGRAPFSGLEADDHAYTFNTSFSRATI